MFWKNKCNFCGYKINNDWNYCPNCGKPTKDRNIEGIFSGMFEDIEKEFERIDKMFKTSDFDFKSPKIKGGSIHITVQSGTGMEPKVEIRTSGEYKKLEPEIKRRFGLQEITEKEEKQRKVKITEEPKAKKIMKGNKTIITIELPDVKSEEDIEIKRLEQSIEIKAFAGDKAYFKLIPIPENATINKKFKDGILEIEIER